MPPGRRGLLELLMPPGPLQGFSILISGKIEVPCKEPGRRTGVTR